MKKKEKPLFYCIANKMGLQMYDNGEIMKFPTKAKAQKEADKINKKIKTIQKIMRKIIKDGKTK